MGRGGAGGVLACFAETSKSGIDRTRWRDDYAIKAAQGRSCADKNRQESAWGGLSEMPRGFLLTARFCRAKFRIEKTFLHFGMREPTVVAAVAVWQIMTETVMPDETNGLVAYQTRGQQNPFISSFLNTHRPAHDGGVSDGRRGMLGVAALARGPVAFATEGSAPIVSGLQWHGATRIFDTRVQFSETPNKTNAPEPPCEVPTTK